MNDFLIDRFGRAVGRPWRLRDGVRRLTSLDDRMLCDIGISRGEIRGAVRGRRAG